MAGAASRRRAKDRYTGPDILDRVYALIRERKLLRPAGRYMVQLLDGRVGAIGDKHFSLRPTSGFQGVLAVVAELAEQRIGDVKAPSGISGE